MKGQTRHCWETLCSWDDWWTKPIWNRTSRNTGWIPPTRNSIKSQRHLWGLPECDGTGTGSERTISIDEMTGIQALRKLVIWPTCVQANGSIWIHSPRHASVNCQFECFQMNGTFIAPEVSRYLLRMFHSFEQNAVVAQGRIRSNGWRQHRDRLPHSCSTTGCHWPQRH